MMLIPTAIPDAPVIEPKVFGDAHGYFYENFYQKAFNEANHSRSTKGVLRDPWYSMAFDRKPQSVSQRPAGAGALRGRDFLMAVVRVTVWPKPCQLYSAIIMMKMAPRAYTASRNSY